MSPTLISDLRFPAPRRNLWSPVRYKVSTCLRVEKAPEKPRRLSLPRPYAARAHRATNSFNRLWVRQTNDHSPRIFVRPRKEN